MASGFGTVKAVLSGDTLLLVGKSKGGPPPTRQLSLAGIKAPKLARSERSGADEPFAWAAREHLRKLCIGQVVKFDMAYRVAAISRDFADVTMRDGTNLAVSLVAAGLARPNPQRDGKQSNAIDEIQAKAEAAELKGLGVWNAAEAASAIRPVKWEVAQPGALLAATKGKPQPAVVEGVSHGTSLRVILLDSFQVVHLSLAAVQSPRVNYSRPATTAAAPKPAAATAPAPPSGADESKGDDAGAGAGNGSGKSYLASAGAGTGASGSHGGSGGSDAFGDLAKHFVEMRLLQRDVNVYLNGLDKYGRFVGDVEYDLGDISLELVKAGLARIVDWSSGFTKKTKVANLRAAELAAKRARTRIWKSWTPPVIEGRRNYNGTVVEVVSGDTIMVLLDGTDAREERRVSLSSTRAPYGGRRDGGAEPLAKEAQDFVRKTCIGRTVAVHVDYERDGRASATGAAPKRTYATVTVTSRKGKPNLAELLIREGLATVIRHRADSDEKASAYDALRAAEDAAKAAKKNLHAGDVPPPKRVQSLIGNPTLARQFLTFLKRDRVQKAIVEFVVSAGRFKLFIPSQNCQLFFAVGGIRCPGTARRANGGQKAREAEPFGNEAALYMRDNALQRTVEVEVSSMDPRGCAIGSMWLGRGGQRRNVAVQLLELGYAKTMYNADRSRHADELFAAQRKAQASKAGLWSVHVEAAPVVAATPAETKMGIKVAEVLDGASFFAHKTSDAATFDSINAGLMQMLESVGTSGDAVEVPRKAIVAALFDDGRGSKWYRARVEGKVAGGDLIKVTYIDFGNREDVPMSRLRPLEPALARYSPMAVECALAYVRVPEVSTDLGHQAGVYLNDLIWDCPTLVARVHYQDDQKRLMVSLTNSADDSGTTVNELMIRGGLARMAKTDIRYAPTADKPLVAKLREAQEEATRNHEGMYRYGDVGDSDDEELR